MRTAIWVPFSNTDVNNCRTAHACAEMWTAHARSATSHDSLKPGSHTPVAAAPALGWSRPSMGGLCR
jgi:hypothetical protein